MPLALWFPRRWRGLLCGVLCFAILACCGCTRLRSAFKRDDPIVATPPPTEVPVTPIFAEMAPPVAVDESMVVVRMNFDVLRVELPADEVRHSAKAWNHVDELRGDPTRTALLRRNGVRVGVASADVWPALRGVFEASGAKSLRASHTAEQNLPLTLDLGEIAEDENIFLKMADDRVVGTTFDRGHRYLHIDYALNLDDETVVSLRITPEIHRTSKTRYWREEDGDLRRSYDYEGRVFHELSVVQEVPVGSFLVVGPDTEKSSPLTIGSRFLTRSHSGRDYDTILCITPQPYQAQTAGR
jgi:hypothetical protein